MQQWISINIPQDNRSGPGQKQQIKTDISFQKIVTFAMWVIYISVVWKKKAELFLLFLFHDIVHYLYNIINKINHLFPASVL